MYLQASRVHTAYAFTYAGLLHVPAASDPPPPPASADRSALLRLIYDGRINYKKRIEESISPRARGCYSPQSAAVCSREKQGRASAGGEAFGYRRPGAIASAVKLNRNSMGRGGGGMGAIYVSRVARQLTPPTITSSRPPAISTESILLDWRNVGTPVPSSDATLRDADAGMTRHRRHPGGGPGVPAGIFDVAVAVSLGDTRQFIHIPFPPFTIFTFARPTSSKSCNAEECDVFAHYTRIFACYVCIFCVNAYAQIVSGKFNFANADRRECDISDVKINFIRLQLLRHPILELKFC